MSNITMIHDGMSTQILEQEIEAVRDQIKRIEEEEQLLTRQKDQAIKRGDNAAAIKARRELKPLAEQLEELQIKKDAAESKLRISKESAPKAAAIRKRIVTELWPRGLKAYGAVQQMFDKLPALLREAAEMDGSIQQLCEEHFRLTGERLQVDRFGLDPQIERKLGELRIFPLPPAERFQLTDLKLVREVK